MPSDNDAVSDAGTVDDPRMNYIKAIRGEICGPLDSRLLYYRNIHPTWTIKILVDHHWVHNDRVYREQQEYVLSPNSRAGTGVHPLDVRMGCPIPGPTLQRFHWDVVDAVVVSGAES
ncbi:MAG: hypothetical protein LC667_04895 [Thioalkalivibrio sp.]|nr:hypothetical protein [Thioalkalivibrio sp.]